MYRLYIDETGNADLKASRDPDGAQGGDALIARKESNRDWLPGLKFHTAGSAIEISVDRHPDPADLFP